MKLSATAHVLLVDVVSSPSGRSLRLLYLGQFGLVLCRHAVADLLGLGATRLLHFDLPVALDQRVPSGPHLPLQLPAVVFPCSLSSDSLAGTHESMRTRTRTEGGREGRGGGGGWGEREREKFPGSEYLLFGFGVLNSPEGEGPHLFQLFILPVQHLTQVHDHLPENTYRCYTHLSV